MVSFKEKIGWKRPKNRENKNIFPFCFYTTCNRKFQKNGKKIQNIKKYQ